MSCLNWPLQGIPRRLQLYEVARMGHHNLSCDMPADTVGDLGYAEELGNYAEYSGAPNTQVRIEPRHLIQHCMLSAVTWAASGALWCQHCPSYNGWSSAGKSALWNRGRL